MYFMIVAPILIALLLIAGIWLARGLYRDKP